MTILCLDLGTTTGWARHEKGVITSGAVSFKPKKYEGAGHRYLQFWNWLEKNTAGVDYIFFEAVRRHAGTDAAHVYGGLMAFLESFCEENNIPYAGVGVTEIKKHATGKGNAPKEMMIAAMQAKGHISLTDKDHDEADALAIMYLKLEKAPF